MMCRDVRSHELPAPAHCSGFGPEHSLVSSKEPGTQDTNRVVLLARAGHGTTDRPGIWRQS